MITRKIIISLSLIGIMVAPSVFATTPLQCLSITHNLRYQTTDKATGGDVSKLQGFLVASGYLTSAPSGYFGAMTLSAVKRFQAAKHLDVSGYVGPLTRVQINTSGCTSGSQTNTTPSATPSVTASAVPTATPTPEAIPTITSISVNTAPNDGITPVTISGSHFSKNSVIYFAGINGVQVIPYTVSPDGSSLSFYVPPRVGPSFSGAYQVAVSNDGVHLSNATELLITIAPLSRYTIITDYIPDAYLGQPYFTGAQANGFDTDFGWSISSGSLPPGITILNNPATSYMGQLMLGGTPQTAGKYTFTIKVASANNSASRSFSMTVLPDPNATSLIPAIYGLSAYSGKVGTGVTINGGRFDSKNYILLNGRVAGQAVSSSDGKSLSFTIPTTTTPACNLFSTGSACPHDILIVSAGIYSITVQNIHGTSRGFDFTVLPPDPTPTPTPTAL
jgi:peptidoglycan hydrolase-like protein with peptidoglycan-binding domain